MNIELTELNRQFMIIQFKLDVQGRIRIWRKLAKLLKNGVPIIKALERIVETLPQSHPARFGLREWVAMLKNGRPFEEAVKKWVPAEEAMLIAAGGEARLHTMLESVVRVVTAKRQTIAAVKSGLGYPMFLILVSFVVLYFFSYKLIPSFQLVAKGDNWVGLARIMVNVSAIVQVALPWALACFMALIGGVMYLMPNWTGSSRVIADRMVPFSIYRVIHGSSWIIALSSMVQAGMRIEKAMEKLMANSTPWARTRIAGALRGIKSGVDLGKALEQTKFEFPDREIIADIQIYSSIAGIDEALLQIGEEWIEESVSRIKQLMALLFSVTLLIAGSIIAFQVAGMLSMELQLQTMMRATGV